MTKDSPKDSQKDSQIDIYRELEALLDFAELRLMLQSRDRLVARHRLYLFLQLKGDGAAVRTAAGNILAAGTALAGNDVYQLTKGLLDWAASQQLYDAQSITEMDLFLANLLGQLMPLASQLESHFWQLYRSSPDQATDFFYQISQDSAYIRSDRLAQNFCWEGYSHYGQMEITINLSKPEKDPKAIAAAANTSAQQQGRSYPQCVLCWENEGYAGHLSWAARYNHRVVGLQLDGQDFALQYSPYLYYPEHSILLSKEHKPMAIDSQTFAQMFDFVRQFPHYMVGSNADLPIVGGSILSHHHFQAGRYEFPMFQAAVAPYSRQFDWSGLQALGSGVQAQAQVRAEILQWPLSCLKLSGPDAAPLLDIAERVLQCWRSYSYPSVGILAYSDAPHNTITPILRRLCGGDYELFLVLRNNRSSEQHPLGIYHPHAEIHHIKKENIGLIEVMGLAILPGRLKQELQLMEAYLLARQAASERQRLSTEEALIQHLPWLNSLENQAGEGKLDIPTTGPEISQFLRTQVAEVFAEGLSHCGVLPTAEAWQGFLQNCGLAVS